jgi:hypothetical protein
VVYVTGTVWGRFHLLVNGQIRLPEGDRAG